MLWWFPTWKSLVHVARVIAMNYNTESFGRCDAHLFVDIPSENLMYQYFSPTPFSLTFAPPRYTPPSIFSDRSLNRCIHASFSLDFRYWGFGGEKKRKKIIAKQTTTFFGQIWQVYNCVVLIFSYIYLT